MRKVLVVDDSPTARLALRRVIDTSGGVLGEAGEASTGREAMELIDKLHPHIVALDVHLEPEDGCALAATIMTTRPMPIVLVTGVSPNDPALAFRALQVGALEVLPKPPAPSSPCYEAECQRFVRLFSALSHVPVVRRRGAPPAPSSVPWQRSSGSLAPHSPRTLAAIDLIVIGASTGGPPLLQELLRGPPTLPVPIVVVQHMANGFGHGFATWLGETTGQTVIVCDRELSLSGGVVFVAPDDAHLTLSDRRTLVPRRGAPRCHLQSSVDELFESVARVSARSTLAVLLTGMGSDGCTGLMALRNAGALTVAQEPSTCVVDGMPRSAIERGAAEKILTPAEIREVLAEVRRVSRTGGG